MPLCTLPGSPSSGYLRHVRDGMSGKGWVAVERAPQDMGSESDDSVYYDLDSPRPSPEFHFFEGKPRASNGRPLEDSLARLAINGHKEERKEEEDEEECEELILMDGDCYSDRRTEESSSEEEVEERKAPLKRSSSLKVTKKEEGCSGEKKIVRFADALGLDLAAVRTFMDEVPKVPKSAFKDLEGVEVSASPPVGSPMTNRLFAPSFKTVVPLFRQPSAHPDFMERLNRSKVCLESALVSDPSLFTVTGVVRVVNLDFHKSVLVRHTRDGWRTHSDVRAKYVEGSCDGFSDRFRFALFAHTLAVGERLEFALRYDVKGTQYWDNNRGANYALQCIPDATPRPPPPVLSAYAPSDNWGASLFF